MKKIVVYGWKVNFNKIGFTKFLRKEFGYTLYVVRGITDGISENKAVTLQIEENKLQAVLELEELRASFTVD